MWLLAGSALYLPPNRPRVSKIRTPEPLGTSRNSEYVWLEMLLWWLLVVRGGGRAWALTIVGRGERACVSTPPKQTLFQFEPAGAIFWREA